MRRNDLPEWRALQQHCDTLRGSTIAEFFAANAGRAEHWRVHAPHVDIDYSRQLADARALELLFALARACGVSASRAAMFAGEPVNTTERRPAWHTALRTPPSDTAVAQQVAEQRERFLAVAEKLRADARDGRIDRVVVIGIGGSDLGPRLATAALGPASGPRVSFVNNLDPVALQAAIDGGNPATTAVIAISKSFTTLETIENLKIARDWLGAGGGADVGSRLYAVTSAPRRAEEFGVRADNTLIFPDWVGGRFSVWSACGLPVAIAHGREVFSRLLAGASAMDQHFLNASDATNAPLLLALLDVWNASFLEIPTKALFPYAERLRQLPLYLQQLEMESCGKRVDSEGVAIGYPTAPPVWGEAGTTAQHSVFQFLHQGTWTAAVEFVVVRAFRESAEARERLLFAFAEAQADALAFGDAALAAESRPIAAHAECPGSRPSTVVLLDALQAQSIGALLAFYEHRTAAASWIWNINAFDQWGVEIGKRLLESRLTSGR